MFQIVPIEHLCFNFSGSYFLLAIIWLGQGQLLVIDKKTATLILCESMSIIQIDPEVLLEPGNEVGSQSPADCVNEI